MTKRTDITHFSGLSAHRFAAGQLMDADCVRLHADSAVESLGAAIDLYHAGAGDLLAPGIYTTNSCIDPDYETEVTRDWIYTHIAPEADLGTADFKGDFRFSVAPVAEYGKNADGYRHVVAAFCHGDELCILYSAAMHIIEERFLYELEGFDNGSVVQVDASYNETAGTGVWVRTLTQLILDRYLPSGEVKTQPIRGTFMTHKIFKSTAETHRTLVKPKSSDSYHHVSADYAPLIGGSYSLHFDTLHEKHYPTLDTDYPLHTVGYPERLRKASFCLWASGTNTVGLSRRFQLLPEMLDLYGSGDASVVDAPVQSGVTLNAGVQLFGRLYGINETEIHASKNGTIGTFTTPTAAASDDPDAAWCDTVKGAGEAFTAIAAFDGKIIAFTARSMLTVRGQALPFELSYVGAYGCLSAEALAVQEKYLYFVSESGVMRYDGTHVSPLDAPLPAGSYTGAELLCTGDLLLLYVPGQDGIFLYDIAGGGWSFRRAAGTTWTFPGDNRESTHFCSVVLQNTENGSRPVRLFGAAGSFSAAIAVPFAGRRRLHTVSLTAALQSGAVLSICGADGRVLHSFTGMDGKVHTYHAVLRNAYLDSGALRLTGSGSVRIFGISLHTSEAAVLRRRIHPQQKKEGGSQT